MTKPLPKTLTGLRWPRKVCSIRYSHKSGMIDYYTALEYEREHGMHTLQSFFDSSIPKLQHPQIQSWGRDILNERAELQSALQKSLLLQEDM